MRLQELVDECGGINFRHNEQTHTLAIVPRYKHTGIWARRDGKCSTDIATKGARMREAARPLRKPVFFNPHLSVIVKTAAAHTHVPPAGEFGSGTWQPTAHDLQKYSRGVMDTCRLVVNAPRAPPKAHLNVESDIAVLQQLEVVAPNRRLCIARLRLLSQCLRRRATPNIFL